MRRGRHDGQMIIPSLSGGTAYRRVAHGMKVFEVKCHICPYGKSKFFLCWKEREREGGTERDKARERERDKEIKLEREREIKRDKEIKR